MPPRARSRQRRSRVTLDQLRTFQVVADLEHITDAADALRISQGSVSTQIGRLETALGLPLFERIGRNIRLTDVGRSLRPLAGRVLEEVEQVDQLRQGFLHLDRGELTIAAGRVMGAHRLAAWLAPFALSHPQVAIRVSLAPMHTLIERLLNAEADIVIAGSPVPVPDVESLVLERTTMVLVVAAQHPLASSAHPLQELALYRYLAHEAGTATEPRATQALGTYADVAPTVELEEGALLAALLAGLGFAVMPRAVVESDIAEGRLVLLPQPGRRVLQAFSAARRRGPHTPVQEAYWEHLRTLSEAA